MRAPTAFATLTRAQWKGYWREKQNWFWMLAFPLMFLLLFGFLFRDADTPQPHLAVVGDIHLLDQLPEPAMAQFTKLFDVTHSETKDTAVAEVQHGKLDGALVEEDGQLRLYYSAADAVMAATVRGILQGFVDAANQAVSPTPPAFVLDARPVENQQLKVIQYIAPGLLGWAIAMGGVFSTAMPLVTWRTTRLLRRLRLTPVGVTSLAASRTVVALAMALLQTAAFLGVGAALFGLRLEHSWWLSIPLVLVGTLSFMTIGMVVGAVSPTPDAASGLSNVVILPMAFLSGSFISLESAPAWMKHVADVLPMGQLNQGLSNVLVNGDGPSALVVPMLTLVGFGIAFGLLSARLFRWEE